MKRFFLAFTLVCFALFGLDRPLEAAEPVVVASPDGAIKAELTSADGVLRYRITVDGSQVLAPSTLGILADGNELGRDAVWVLRQPAPLTSTTVSSAVIPQR